AGNVLLSIQRETACNQFRSRVDFDIGIVENFLKHYLITDRPNCDFVSLLSNPPNIERSKHGTRMDSIRGELGSSVWVLVIARRRCLPAAVVPVNPTGLAPINRYGTNVARAERITEGLNLDDFIRRSTNEYIEPHLNDIYLFRIRIQPIAEYTGAVAR